jgi:plasmid stability protein
VKACEEGIGIAIIMQAEASLTSLLVRNVDADTLARLKARAERHGRSLQAEVLVILEAEAALGERGEWLEEMRHFRARTGPFPGPDSTELLRESRDGR